MEIRLYGLGSNGDEQCIVEFSNNDGITAPGNVCISVKDHNGKELGWVQVSLDELLATQQAFHLVTDG